MRAILCVAAACAVAHPRTVAAFCWTPGRTHATLNPYLAPGTLPLAMGRARRASAAGHATKASMAASRAAGFQREAARIATLHAATATAMEAAVPAVERLLRAISSVVVMSFSSLLASAARLAASLILLFSLTLSTPALSSMVQADVHREPPAHSLLVHSPLASGARNSDMSVH
jgi:hypothetical protein